VKDGHHDTHATPPLFIQEAYWRYNKIKPSDVDGDLSVIDFGRGLSAQQKLVMKPVSTIASSVIEQACKAFRNAALKINRDDPLRTPVQDVTIFEHQHFPGLRIAPNVLPPETQVLFVSQVMHKYLANLKHKNNLEADYDIEPPILKGEAEDLNKDTLPQDQCDDRDPASSALASMFATATHDVTAHPKLDTVPQTPLNAAQFLSKKLRWLTLGSQYHWPTRSYDPNTPTTFPSDLHTLVTGLFPDIKPESGVCLLYGGKDFMPTHRDVSEQCQTALASFSFGCDGLFVVAKGEEEVEDEAEKAKRTVTIRVRSGDCVIMDGETRWAWHAMPKVLPGTCPKWLDDWPMLSKDDPEGGRWTAAEKKAFAKWKGYMGRKRLNVSCRQVWS
jgi:alkylated DNA repair protein alkB family protein 1